MVGSVVVSGVLGLLALIGFTIAIPNDAAFAQGGLPGVFQYWIGSGLSRTFVGIVVFSMFALAVVAAAANARLIFAMARDNMLPASSVLSRVNPGTKTPIPALLVAYVIAVGLMLFGYNSSGSAFDTMVGATALVPFLVYFLTVVAYGWRRRKLERLEGAFHLGSWAVPVFVAALVWLVVAILAVALPHGFHKADEYVLGGLVLAALWWALGLRPRLVRGTAGNSSMREASMTSD
jgi:amino acid transporter